MKNTAASHESRKRKLFDSPAIVSRSDSGDIPRTPYCDVVYDGISLTPCGITEDCENIENTSPAIRRLLPLPSRKSPHSPVHITSDGRFEKPTAFISPITRTMAKVPKAVQVNTYTSPLLDKRLTAQPFLVHFI